MPAFAHPADFPGGAFRVGDEAIKQGGFAHPGVADEGADLARDVLAEFVQGVADAGGEDLYVEIAELGGEGAGVGEVGFGEADQRGEAADEGGDEGAFHEAGARRWIGHGADDQQVVRIGHDDPLERVRVVRSAAQNGGAVFEPHDARQGVLLAGGIADHTDVVSDDYVGAPHLAGAHAGDEGAIFV